VYSQFHRHSKNSLLNAHVRLAILKFGQTINSQVKSIQFKSLLLLAIVYLHDMVTCTSDSIFFYSQVCGLSVLKRTRLGFSPTDVPATSHVKFRRCKRPIFVFICEWAKRNSCCVADSKVA
jgi:hypothetical protein